MPSLHALRPWLVAILSSAPLLAAQAAPGQSWQQTQANYRLPMVRLVGADGSARSAQQALDDGRPTVLTFMYSSCATVCPIVNQTMVEFERLLAAERGQVNTVSITIDPTHDTVQKLAEHARRSGAAGAFYTGDPGASEAVQRAFNAWRGGDKMNHTPVFLLKAAHASVWTRIDGLISPRELLQVYRGLGRPADPRRTARAALANAP